MSWNELAYMGLVVKPFDGVKPTAGHVRSRFDAPLRKTLQLLSRELRMLNASEVIVELDVRERDIRLDGYPRADAKAMGQAVRISFKSKHGPLSYATGEFDDWRDNLRAIALSLEALRAVDRYGVSKRGEQYRGWRQIPASTGNADELITSREQAEEFLSRWDGDIRRAFFETHPDRGGDADVFRLVVRAKDLLAA